MRVAGFCAMLALVACRTSPDGRRAESDDPPAAEAPPAATRAVEPAASLEAALDRISAADIRGHIDRLASDDMRGRQTPSPELDEAADHIASALAEAGVEPGPGGARRVAVACGPMGESAANVVGQVPGTSEEAVLVTAHYDHVGEATTGDDRVYNGANDNASGVAAMLEIADALARLPEPPSRSLLFVAFCGEEHGFRGSTGFVEDPPVPLTSIVAVLNLEMLGHPDPADPRRAWVTGHAYSSVRSWLDRGGAPEQVTFVAGGAIGPVEGNAFERSDNYPFAQRGVVAHTIAAGPLDEHYHAVTDEPQRVDVDAMVPLVRALARTAHALATSDERPQWSGAAPARFTRPASGTPVP